MEIFKIALIGIVTTFCVLVLKTNKSELAMLVGCVGGLLILCMVAGMLGDVFSYFATIISKTSISGQIFSTLIKIVGVGCVAEFASHICIDAGNSTLGEYVLLGGKVVILIMAFPLITSLFDLIVGLL